MFMYWKGTKWSNCDQNHESGIFKLVQVSRQIRLCFLFFIFFISVLRLRYHEALKCWIPLKVHGFIYLQVPKEISFIFYYWMIWFNTIGRDQTHDAF